MQYFVQRGNYHKKTKIFIPGNKKTIYYFGTPEYYRSEYLKSDHWKALRSEKLKRCPSCEKCGSNKRVEPHHLQYKNLYDVLLSDLQTLCRQCHMKKHMSSKVSHKKKKRQMKNIFRRQTQIIRTVSRITGMTPEYIKTFIPMRP